MLSGLSEELFYGIIIFFIIILLNATIIKEIRTEQGKKKDFLFLPENKIASFPGENNRKCKKKIIKKTFFFFAFALPL